MYAVVKAGGKQHKVAVGDVVEVNRLEGNAGDEVSLPALLLVDGRNVVSETSALAKIAVTGEIVGHHKGPKIKILKYKNKTGYRRRIGHRQLLTELLVTDIDDGKPKKKATKSEPAKSEAVKADADEKPAKAAKASTKAESTEAKSIKATPTKAAGKAAGKTDADEKPAKGAKGSAKAAPAKPAVKDDADEKPAKAAKAAKTAKSTAKSNKAADTDEKKD